MTLEEYISRKKDADNMILAILMDDSSENVVYDLHRHDRLDSGLIMCKGVFKKYKNLKKAMDIHIELMPVADDEGKAVSDYYWFVINKYYLENGEYKKILSCRISFNGEMLHYTFFDEALKNIDIPKSEDVIKPYNTGDILKVKNKPLTDDFYIIYIYDEKRECHKHIQMYFDEKFEFCTLYWLEKTEKVESCPIEQINEMSKKIKENYEEFNKFFEKQKISPEVHPL